MVDANNITADTFIHASNTHTENAKKIFTNENIDKLDQLVHTGNNFTIKDSKYYESNTATARDTQGDLA